MTPEPVTLPPRVARALELTGLGLALWMIVRYMAPRAGYAWDFDTFYYAAAALRQGLDPYRLESLAAVAGKAVPLPFLYPPASLLVFAPLAALPLATATVAWLTLKVALAAALGMVWRRAFLGRTRLVTLILVALFGFNAALIMDLRSGNIAVLEALALWAAFACYARDRRWAFALLVAVASSLKLLPIAFLALLLVPSRQARPAPAILVAGLAVFGAIVLLPAAWGASWPGVLFAGTPAVRPHGEFNPSALGLFDTLLGGPPRATTGLADPALLLWIAGALTVLIVSRDLLRRAWRRQEATEWVLLACLLFALLSPRMMAYSYVLMIAPALMVIERRFPRRRDRAIAVAVLIAQGVVRLGFGADFLLSVPQLPFRDSAVIANLPYLTVLGLWIALLRAPAAAGREAARMPRPARASRAGAR